MWRWQSLQMGQNKCAGGSGGQQCVGSSSAAQGIRAWRLHMHTAACPALKNTTAALTHASQHRGDGQHDQRHLPAADEGCSTRGRGHLMQCPARHMKGRSRAREHLQHGLPMMMPTKPVDRLQMVRPTFSPMPSWIVWQSSFRPCSSRPGGRAAAGEGPHRSAPASRAGQQQQRRRRWQRQCQDGRQGKPAPAFGRSSQQHHPAQEIKSRPMKFTAGGRGVKVPHILAQHGRQVLVPHVVHLPHACGMPTQNGNVAVTGMA